MAPYVIRSAQPGDTALITHGWLTSYLDSDWGKRLANHQLLKYYAPLLEPDRCKPSTYFYLHRRVVEHLLDTCTTLVAVWVEDPDLILGWACAAPQQGVLHYVAVKPAYRRIGVARALVGHFGVQFTHYTHQTHCCASLPIPPSWVYDPGLAFGHKPKGVCVG